jgi:F-type H+-transporting ATPase subunit delta
MEDRSARDAQLAAELEPDIGVEQIASVYAEALLGAAEHAGQTEPLLEEFDALLEQMIDRFPPLGEILASARISHPEKVGILDRVLAGRVSALLLDFLKVLSRHGRLDCLRAVHRRLHAAYDHLRGRMRVRLATAQPISDELARRIAERLQGVVPGEPVMERVVDPDLIGGAVLRVGDTIYDGSVATQLENLQQQIMDRSAHEIQSRRNRFRDPGRD